MVKNSTNFKKKSTTTTNTNTNNTVTTTHTYSTKLFWLGWFISFVFAFIIFYSWVIRPIFTFYQHAQNFLNTTQILNHQLQTQFINGFLSGLQAPLDNEKVFLILGVDSLDGNLTVSSERDVLTDTMMLVNLNLTTQKIKILSLPRDIFLPDLQMKINGLYNYARLNYQDYPEAFVSAYLEEILDIPIDYTLVFTFDEVRQLIDAIGGLEIDVARSFIDELYPLENTSQDNTTNSLYETVSFNAGPQIMDGNTALKFMRSRHALGEEGSDLARSQRQQKVIDAFLSQLPSKIADIQTQNLNWPVLINLYQVYHQNFASQFSFADLGVLIGQYFKAYFGYPKAISDIELTNPNEADALIVRIENAYLEKSQKQGIISPSDWTVEFLSLPVQPTMADGILREATPREQQLFYYGAWVWVVTNWQEFPLIIQNLLDIKNLISTDNSSISLDSNLNSASDSALINYASN